MAEVWFAGPVAALFLLMVLVTIVTVVIVVVFANSMPVFVLTITPLGFHLAIHSKFHIRILPFFFVIVIFVVVQHKDLHLDFLNTNTVRLDFRSPDLHEQAAFWIFLLDG
jgi:hypothetical protein